MFSPSSARFVLLWAPISHRLPGGGKCPKSHWLVLYNSNTLDLCVWVMSNALDLPGHFEAFSTASNGEVFFGDLLFYVDRRILAQDDRRGCEPQNPVGSSGASYLRFCGIGNRRHHVEVNASVKQLTHQLAWCLVISFFLSFFLLGVLFVVRKVNVSGLFSAGSCS